MRHVMAQKSDEVRRPIIKFVVMLRPSPSPPKKFVNSFNSLLRRPRPIIKFVVMLRPSPSPPKKFVNSFNSLLRRLRPPIKFVVMLRPNKFRCILRPQLPPIKKGVPFRTPFQYFLHHHFKTALAHRGDVDARLLWQLFCRETLSRQVI